jgi:hypothetical protein
MSQQVNASTTLSSVTKVFASALMWHFNSNRWKATGVLDAGGQSDQVAPNGVKALGGVYGYVMQSGLPRRAGSPDEQNRRSCGTRPPPVH